MDLTLFNKIITLAITGVLFLFLVMWIFILKLRIGALDRVVKTAQGKMFQGCLMIWLLICLVGGIIGMLLSLA